MGAQPEYDYSLDNTWEHAQRRLRLLETVWDPATFTRLGELGVGPGWRCLELGAGGGSVARWLGDRVGPGGVVVAVDLEPRFLEADPRPNMEIHRRDIVADGLPGEGYDLIHTRCLLMHLPERDALIADMMTRLRPGGLIVLEEVDLYPAATAESVAFTEVWDGLCDAVLSIGGDWRWARRLAPLLTAVGAVDVRAEALVQSFTGADPMAELIVLSLEQLTPLLLTHGMEQALIDVVRAELHDPAQWFCAFASVTAWGRRPLR